MCWFFKRTNLGEEREKKKGERRQKDRRGEKEKDFLSLILLPSKAT
jgi:hypothetical protein